MGWGWSDGQQSTDRCRNPGAGLCRWSTSPRPCRGGRACPGGWCFGQRVIARSRGRHMASSKRSPVPDGARVGVGVEVEVEVGHNGSSPRGGLARIAMGLYIGLRPCVSHGRHPPAYSPRRGCVLSLTHLDHLLASSVAAASRRPTTGRGTMRAFATRGPSQATNPPPHTHVLAWPWFQMRGWLAICSKSGVGASGPGSPCCRDRPAP